MSTMGKCIAQYRRKQDLTQDALAGKLGVSNQAVSKWESDQCYPDIMLLPKLADIFSVSLDELFGREPAAAVGTPLPWSDDDALHAVLFKGHTLCGDHPKAKEIHLVIDKGTVMDVHSQFSVSCDEVHGNVTAGGDVSCDSIQGTVQAGGNVSCDAVGGSVQAMGDVTCDTVGGDVSAGGDVSCDNITGSAKAGGDIDCDCIMGNAEVGGDISCDLIQGNATAGGDIEMG